MKKKKKNLAGTPSNFYRSLGTVPGQLTAQFKVKVFSSRKYKSPQDSLID